MNKKYVLNKVNPYLRSDKKLCKDDFIKLFSVLNKQQQYEVINILIEVGIEIDYDNSNGEKQKLKTRRITRDMEKLSKLSNEQLCLIYQKGNNVAMDALVNNNTKLVWSRVKKYSSRYKHKLDDQDLFQYGVMGLMKAVEKFNLEKEVKFTTYCTWWIDQQILRSIVDYGFIIRIPVHYFDKVNWLLKIIGENPNCSKQQIFRFAKEKGISKEKFKEILVIIENVISPVSLNTFVGSKEDIEIGDFKVDDVTPTVEEQVEYKQLKENIDIVLNTLTYKERDIIELRFGLRDGIDRTLEQIGHEYNVTRERIRQIEANALKKLKEPSKSKNLKDFIMR